MLYQTLAQPKLLAAFLIAGFLCGLIFDIGNFIKFLCLNKKVPSLILDFLQTSLTLLILFVVNAKLNYGEIRLFVALIFILAFTLERITLSKLIVKFYSSCYNMLEKLNKRIWGKFKSDKTNKND